MQKNRMPNNTQKDKIIMIVIFILALVAFIIGTYLIIKREYFMAIILIAMGIIVIILNIKESIIIKRKAKYLVYDIVKNDILSKNIINSVLFSELDGNKIKYSINDASLCLEFIYNDIYSFNADILDGKYCFYIELNTSIHEKIDEVSLYEINECEDHVMNDTTTDSEIYESFIHYIKNNINNIDSLTIKIKNIIR